MTKSELIDLLAARQDALSRKDIDDAVSIILEQISQALAAGERIEIRGFGSFTLHERQARLGRNPRTGEPVALPVRHVPHFRAGKELRDRVQIAAQLTLPPRRELAEQYINDPSLSLQEISFLLGFSEQSAFSRAYRRWTGQSPSAVRDATA